MSDVKSVVLDYETKRVSCYHGSKELSAVHIDQLGLVNGDDLDEYVKEAGGIDAAIARIKKIAKTKGDFKEYKITITDEQSGSQVHVVWRVIARRGWLLAVDTGAGELWLEDSHYPFSQEHVKLEKDQLQQYFKWLDFNLNNESNLFVPVVKVDDESYAYDRYEFSYIARQYSAEGQWFDVGLKTTIASVSPAYISKLADGSLVAPYWRLKDKMAQGGRGVLMPVRKVSLADLKGLLEGK